jgi:arginine-tRNA-protein transferase
MARILRAFIEDPRTCSYLRDRKAALAHEIVLDMTPVEWESRLMRGWRRFGPVYFRPACAGCMEWVSIRIPTRDYGPSRSQRRALRDCSHLKVVIGPPQVTQDRIALYYAWHRFREEERRWEPSVLDMETYAAQFAFPHPCSREVAYYEERPGAPRRLVGVGLCDETPGAWSAIFFFYHPDLAEKGLGTANVVTQIEIARARGIPYVYLGYRVEDCRSLQYKSRFRPHELLEGRPSLSEPPRWIRPAVKP